MKKYIYLLIAGIFVTTFLPGQCSVSITSLSSSGMTVVAHASGIGNMNPGYAWDWDDSTATTYGANASHAYLYARGYQICVTYTDTVNPFNCIANDCDSIYLFSANSVEENIPLKVDLKAGPNPFTSSLHISLVSNKTIRTELSVYDMTGKEVEKIYTGETDPGIHIYTWKPENLSNGIYFLQTKTGDTIQTRKIVYTGE
jgi:hypothetical protein